MKENFALVFPGQGSQSLGMMNSLKSSVLVRETFEEASSVLDYNLWSLVEEGPEEKLNQTEFTQPALLTSGVALFKVWQQRQQRETGLRKLPKIMAGHSLGEYTALVCAESLAFKDAVSLVSERGRLMQTAVAEGEGAMAAILGLSQEMVLEVCLETEAHFREILFDEKTVSPANFNAPGQVVISGHTAAVLHAMELSKSKGAKRAIRLSVSVPSHCILMKPAAEQFSKYIKAVSFQSPRTAVLHNVDLAFHSEPESIRKALIEQLYRPVRWVETVQRMEELGVQCIYESGPGTVLSSLNKRIAKDITTFSLNFGEEPCLV